MKINVEMTEAEFKEYLLVKRCIRCKRETQEILDLANRLDRLAKEVYGAFYHDEECADIEITNYQHAEAALALATKELY